MSDILDLANDMAVDLHAVGAMDTLTLRMIDRLRLPARRTFTAADVQRIRKQTRLSQPLFALVLNVGRTTVAQWEQGAKKPSGPSARLLDVIDRKGIEAVA
jgi:putative transcriptional regulator